MIGKLFLLLSVASLFRLNTVESMTVGKVTKLKENSYEKNIEKTFIGEEEFEYIDSKAQNHVTSGLWDEVRWSFDESVGVVTLSEGRVYSTIAPWKREIDSSAVKKIVFTGPVILGSSSAGVGLFSDLSNLEEIENLTYVDTKNTLMSGMFLRAHSLRALDLSSFDSTMAEFLSAQGEMFSGTDSLTSLLLGEKFRFSTRERNPTLGAPRSIFPGMNTTGKWMRKDGYSKAYTPDEFMENYGSGDLTPGEYIAELDNPVLQAEVISQMFSLGAKIDINNLDIYQFLNNVKFGPNYLERDEYTVTNKSYISTDTVGERPVNIVIRTNDYPIESDIEIPVTVKWRNTILLNGAGFRSIGAYSYFPETSRIEVSWGTEENTREINNSFGEDVFYRTSIYRPEEAHVLIDQMEKNWELVGRGNQPASIIKDIPTGGIDVSVGDVMEIYHAQSISHQNMTQIYTNETPTTLAQQIETTYIELTKNGYKPLQFNYATVNEGIISSNITDEQLDHQVKDYIDLRNAPQAEVVGFVKYPDRTKLGATEGTIRVQETLSTGKKIQQDYDIPFTVKGTLWGTSPWFFEEDTGTLMIQAGTLAEAVESPWNRSDEYQVDASQIKIIELDADVTAPFNSQQLFSGLPNLNEIRGLDQLETSQVVNMDRIFEGLTSLITLDLTGFDTNNVRQMKAMFQGMNRLRILDISSFDTSNVTTMTNMFSESTSLEQLILGDQFRFLLDANLGFPNFSDSSESSGKWIRKDGQSNAYTPDEFMKNYGTGDLTAGVYVAEEKTIFQIDQVSNFDFGSIRRTSREQTIPVQYDDEVPFIHLTNQSEIDQWSLRVSQKREISDPKGNVLKGAEIILNNLTYSGEPQLVVQQNPITLTEEATEFAWYFNINNGNPKGPSIIQFGTEDMNGVSLKIPKNTVQNTSDYHAKIIWELIGDPTRIYDE